MDWLTDVIHKPKMRDINPTNNLGCEYFRYIPIIIAKMPTQNADSLKSIMDELSVIGI